MTLPPTQPRVLFVSYNPLIEPLGRTRILPYVCGLAGGGDVVVLSFEKRVRILRPPRLDASDPVPTRVDRAEPTR